MAIIFRFGTVMLAQDVMCGRLRAVRLLLFKQD